LAHARDDLSLSTPAPRARHQATTPGAIPGDHVLATVHPANAASVRVLEQCGMVLQAHLPDKNRRLYRLDRAERT
jgi:hypothetical protein